MELRRLRGPPATLTGNNFKIILGTPRDRTNHDRLQDTFRAHRFRQIIKITRPEYLTGLKRIGAQKLNRDLAQSFWLRRIFLAQRHGHIIPDQGSKPPAQSALAFFDHTGLLDHGPKD